ncbi:MAG: hypothetical protein JF616_15720 [Fibrobacteres bacterium]|jgi:hypothetical protein|nr:hypothetical protein [Fibrobacterota bacterium]
MPVRSARIACHLFPLSLLLFQAQAQPLLLVGKSNAEISGAFSYDFLTSPLSRPFDEGLANASFNLPIRASAQANRFLGSSSDSTVVIPDFFARVSQRVNAHVDISAPVFGGIAFFAARENASLSVNGALGDARFNLDTTLENTGSILLRGAIHMPLAFDMEWRSLTFGYAFQPTPYVALGFQIHKHTFLAHTAGDLRPDLSGRIAVGGDAGNASFQVEYPDDKVYGTAQGQYEGDAWSPDLAIRIGPVSLVSRMGVRMSARGHLDLAYSVPFFIDPDTFEPRFTAPDSFLTTDNLRRLLDGETAKRNLHIDDRLILTLPQSHTLTVDLWPGKLALSYTKVFGHVSIHNESSGKSEAAADSGAVGAEAVDTEGFVDLDLFPDQVICLSGRFGWFHGDLGAHSLNVSYRKQGHLLSGASPLEWDGDPIVPILDFGFTWGNPLVFRVDFFISPLPAVRSGIAYAF